MKQLQAKLSAGILTAVMILGMVFTMAPMKAVQLLIRMC